MTEEQRNEQRRTRSAGFTLIEILLVVVIIGMLATIAAINVPKFLGQGREGKAKADVSNISTAIHAYNMVEGKYPGSLSDLMAGDDPYMESIPKDPWGKEYVYRRPSSRKGLRFEVFSYGEDGSESGDDIGNWAAEN
ncbi:MAG: type II secretion system protein GspG [Verrucomicrobia bacterium]|nr:type II secretion system protein GspG [Kiritimatiellia bacterium]MCB1102255.1 type II secretion system protein GspG [Kiritimatiellia bacterium]MCP5487113.1 type II secretion system protein GspG [Verrucomicrobiota bacterium]